MSNMRNELGGTPLKCWIKGVHDCDEWGWKWLGLARVRWIDGENSWILYLGNRTYILCG